MKLAFFTMGCKVNQADSLALRQRMLAAGYIAVEPDDQPDVLVINSCAVTAESERKTRQKLRHFRVINRDCILVLTGCAVQTNPNAVFDYPEADLILGHRDVHNLPSHLEAFLRCGERVVLISPHQRDESFERHENPFVQAGDIAAHTRANVKIEDGCDRFCSYCIIPHARGRVRSKPLPALQAEVQALATAGYTEIVLVGINLSAYGTDLGCTLCDAVELVAATKGVRRIRLGSLEPDLLTTEVLLRLSRCKSLCPHFHISLQSGCDNTLHAMKRGYTAERYHALAQEITNLFHNAALTTDIMVAFPGESSEDFAESLRFVEFINFSKVHVFPFSARRGTPAAEMPHQLTKATKLTRARQMLVLAEQLHAGFLTSQVGQVAEVLLEQPHPRGGMQGYTENYTPVRVPDALLEMRNTIVKVRITAVEGDLVLAEPTL